MPKLTPIGGYRWLYALGCREGVFSETEDLKRAGAVRRQYYCHLIRDIPLMLLLEGCTLLLEHADRSPRSQPRIDNRVVLMVYNVFGEVASVFEGLSEGFSDKGDVVEGVDDGFTRVLGNVFESV